MSGRTGLNIYFNTLALLVNNKPLFPYQNTWALQSMYTARKSSYRDPRIIKWLRSLTWLGGRLLSNWTPGTRGMPSTIIWMLPRTQTSFFWWKCARKGRREGDRLRLPSVPLPWFLAVHHQSLVSRSPLPCKKRSAWGGGWFECLFHSDWAVCPCFLSSASVIRVITQHASRRSLSWKMFIIVDNVYKEFSLSFVTRLSLWYC